MRIRPISALGAAIVMLICFLTGASAQEACPSSLGALDVGGTLTCRCTADQIAGGGVYGSARYSSDSSLCKAARHAGAIPDGGGVVTVHAAEGCPKSVGSTANGITTSSWSSAVPKTFAFAKPAPACGLATVAATPAAPATASQPATPAAAPALAKDCPRTMNAAGMSPGQSVTCTCTAEATQVSGSIYGTDLYSSDSLTCVAARHAGKVDAKGGSVSVYVAEGCARFEGTERNGVTTRTWSSTVPQTFAFVLPVPACPAAPKSAPPSGPAPGPPMAAWQARATAYAAALPEALPGWKANDRETVVQNSSVSGREVTGYRLYRLGQNPANLDAINIYISNNPDGSARYPIENWRDEAQRTAANMKMVKSGGRDAMEGKSGDITTIWFLMSNNLFVGLSWQETHVKRDQVDAYIKAIDFARIEKLASK